MTKITDPAVLEACDFLNRFYEKLEPLAPDRGSREEQHAILVLSAYIREQSDCALHDTHPEGEVAFLGDLELDDNPYPEGTPAWRGWRSGWLSAREADQDDPTFR